jgi:WD40 repeat protein
MADRPRRFRAVADDDAVGYPGAIARWPSAGWLVADCGRDLVVWDPRADALIARLAHDPPARAPHVQIAVDDDTGTALVAHGARDFALWSLERVARLRVFAGHAEEVRAVVFADDAIVSASGDGTVRRWDRTRGACQRALEVGPTFALARHPAVDVIAACGAQGGHGRITLIDPRFDVAHTIIAPVAPLDRAACTPLSAARRRQLGTAADRRDHARIASAAWHPDGRHLITGGDDYLVKMFDAETGTLVRTWAGHGHWITAVAVTADGARIVSGSTDGHVRTWSTDAPTCLAISDELPGTVEAVFLDGDRIHAACSDGSIYALPT